MKILVINGPNLNLLGKREPEIYGTKGLETINKELQDYTNSLNIDIDFFQSNTEGMIVDKIQECIENYDYLIINPGALTHYSISIRDAILSVGIKTIEVHISNVYAREPFRHKSVISDIVIGKITGFGIEGYKMAISYINSLR